MRADLLRLLGTVLCEVGDLAQAQEVLSESSAIAKAAGLSAADLINRLGDGDPVIVPVEGRASRGG